MSKPLIYENDLNLLSKTILSGKLAYGELAFEFEKAFARYIGTSHAVSVSSGTSALHLAILACGFNKGDEIITSPFSFIASANAILHSNATPVFVDIDPVSYNLDPKLIESKINARTKAILGVHLFGQAFDISEVEDICKRYNLVLLEDACQSHGAHYQSKKVGSFGVGCFSFYPTKNMTTGEGGMITTSDKSIADRCRILRNQGQESRYYHTMLGHNYRMDEIKASLGLTQLKRLNHFNRKRDENAKVLTKAVNEISGLISPGALPDRNHVYNQFTIRVTPAYKLSRNELIAYLEDNGIGCAVHYPLPIYKQPIYKELGYKDWLPVAEQAAIEVLSLPVHPSITCRQLNRITQALLSA